jgi:hypothetical protein
MKTVYGHIARMRTNAEFKAHVLSQGVSIPFDDEVVPAPEGALAQPFVLKDGKKIGILWKAGMEQRMVDLLS